MKDQHQSDPGNIRSAPPLDNFFHPRTVAVIGASARRESASGLLYRTVRKAVEGAGGTVHPVNPKYPDIGGRACYPSIADVPGELDLVVIAAGDPVETLTDALAVDPKFVMMFAAGFAESGEDGAAIQRKLHELISASNSYLLGPNTTLNSFLPLDPDLAGPQVALISHSGHQGRHLWEGQKLGIPLFAWAPTGNEVDLELADFIRYFADKDEVGAIAGYVEGFKDGRTFVAAAEYAADRATPIVLVKVGRTEQGQSTVLSHTAHLAGSDDVSAGVFRQHGVVRAEGMDDLLQTTAFLARAKPPAAQGVCVYSLSGGTAAHLTDLIAHAGLSVPELAQDTQIALREWIPGYLRVSNPVDSGGNSAADWRGRKILEALAADPNIGVIVVPFVADAYHLSTQIVKDIVEVAAEIDKPICVVWGAPISTSNTYTDVLVPSGLPVFRTFHQCVAALQGYFDYHVFLARRSVEQVNSPGPLPALPDASGPLSEWDSKQLVRGFGVRVSTDVRVTTAEEAEAAAREIGSAVVVKVDSADIAHKSDLGLVRVGVAPEQVADVHDEIVRAARTHLPDATVAGTIVSTLVTGGQELVVGVTHDDVFGATLMVGFGGASIEAVPDVTFRVPPFSREEAGRMVRELRQYPLLLAHRGKPAADVEAFVDVVMQIHDMVLVAGDRIRELDLNPVIVTPAGATVVDAMIVLR